MKWVFWASVSVIAWTYLGYPLWLYVRSRWHARPVRTAPMEPSVSIIMAVHNEAEALPRKLRNLSEIDYPSDRYEIIVTSDGSTDGTNQILAAQACDRLHAMESPWHQGKACAISLAIKAAKGEILVLTDARQLIAPDAVRRLVANFADPAVGCVSGELILGQPVKTESGNGVGLYWRMEKKIRQWESVTGSVVGATGALYAVRRELAVPLPPGTLLDDVYLPLHVVCQAKRVVFEPGARAYDAAAAPRQEFRRKVRTLTGNYQLLRLAPWLLTRANPVRFEFVCHKLLRLLVPFALAGMLLSSALLPGMFYALASLVQLVFYGSAALSVFRSRLGMVSRLADVSLAFLVMNMAAAVAFIYFVTGKRKVWVR